MNGKPRNIADVRAEQEAAKAQWSMAVREGIIEALRANRDGFHADDLEPLGIPDEHRNIIGSQIAKLVNQRWIEECGRRKSRIPSRNGAKSNVYRVTALGWEKLSGVGVGVPNPQGPGGANSSPLSASADPGENSSAAPSTAAGESARLFELPSRSAITDAEAA